MCIMSAKLTIFCAYSHGILTLCVEITTRHKDQALYYVRSNPFGNLAANPLDHSW